MSGAQNIGIKAVEIYFPSQCVDQAELEKFDGVSSGKYTIGLGQTRMSFCDDREDIYSFALTVVHNLLEKNNIDPNSIGRLEVGTETLLDKSKSVKSVLMQLFTPSGNTNIEGVDNVNACYGGTNAVFNAVNWVESSAWDGRDAIVVAGDIALYKKGNARPTGGAGAVALLIGPDAPLVFEPGKRGSYFTHAYDFYKPDLTSEYPYVDGHYSIRCYTEAVDNCYKAYNEREIKLAKGAALEKTGLDRFDHILFHAPTCKLVQKSYARLLYNDYLADPSAVEFSAVPAELQTVEYTASITDRNIEKAFMGLSKSRFEQRIKPTITIPTMCGNMYSATVYAGLVSLLGNATSEELQGKRIGVFSYGSGLASSFFSLTVKGDTSALHNSINLQERLDARRVVDPQVFDDLCVLREKAHLKKNFVPAGDPSTIIKNTYYLVNIDDMFRREYVRQT
ncbi:hydroxymethylglutaryl-CoA synthase [Peziza echinospora]|nr:hydroxymethylglutaryl-CoA synthase [Peziza echinospora]